MYYPYTGVADDSGRAARRDVFVNLAVIFASRSFRVSAAVHKEMAPTNTSGPRHREKSPLQGAGSVLAFYGEFGTVPPGSAHLRARAAKNTCEPRCGIGRYSLCADPQALSPALSSS